MDEPFLRLENLQKRFGTNTVVHGADLEFGRGEFVSFLGPSGCGKTTVLRMIAGFEKPSAGRIIVDGADVTALSPRERRIGMVFQAYALFPNMNVADNIAFGLKVANTPGAQARERVAEMLRIIGLSGFEKRFPFELSGGQQQRVALARALAPRPRMLLLDEPLSALDAKIRVSLRSEIRSIQRELSITTIFVTHDQEEALSISDRVVVMNAGRVEQVGAPQEIYNRPASRFVANFVGLINTLQARVADGPGGHVRIGDELLPLAGLSFQAPAGAEVTIGIRPEGIVIDAAERRDLQLRGHVVEVEFLGPILRIKARVGGTTVSLDTLNHGKNPPEIGLPITVGVDRDQLLFLS